VGNSSFVNNLVETVHNAPVLSIILNRGASITLTVLNPPGKRSNGEAVSLDDIEKRIGNRQEELCEFLRRRTREWQRPPGWWEKKLDEIGAAADHFANRWNALMTRLRTVEQLYFAA
jgi:hypothetical protein